MINSGLSEVYYEDGQRYYLYVPDSVLRRPEEAYILAAIHGYSGRTNDAEGIATVKNTALTWSSLAEEYGWVVLAPHFDEYRFSNDYQRLNISVFGTGIRADVRLNELAQEVGQLIPGINWKKMYLFGFSGGGQFVHRYVAFQPDRVLRAVSASSGWYMWPDETLLYPVGTLILLEGLKPRIRELLSANLLVLVGTEDTTDSSFRETYYIQNDLTTIQGSTRIERAVNWVGELEKIAKQENIVLNVELKFAEDTGHSISYELKTLAADYLTADTVPVLVRLSPWDVNRDGMVNASDLTLVSRYLGSATTIPSDPNPDVNRDGKVNLLDIILVAKHFGRTYSPAALILSKDPQDQ